MKEIIKLDKHNLQETAAFCAEQILAGKVILIPFDTVMGFAANAKNCQSVEKIFELKERDKNHTIGLAATNMESLSQIAVLTSEKLDFIDKKAPGPFTFILKKKTKAVMCPLCVKENTIAVRITNSILVNQIANLCGGYISQTSANKSGKDTAPDLMGTLNQFTKAEITQIGAIVDGGELFNSASEIIDLTSKKPRCIERISKK